MYMPQILFTMANLRAVRAEVRGPADLARLQLDRPAARVALYTDRAEPVEVLSFGRIDEATGLVHVRRDSTRFVYLVTRQILDELRRPTLAARRPADVPPVVRISRRSVREVSTRAGHHS